MDQKRRANVFIGSAIERVEDLRLLRGRGQFVDDLARENLLHAVILRSSVAHGRIRSVDVTAAWTRPGVHAVITAAEIGTAIPTIPLRQDSSPAFRPFEQPVIAYDKVRYVGEPIAVVLAETAAAAEDALDAIDVAIDPLPAVVTSAAALTDQSLLFDGAGTVAFLNRRILAKQMGLPESAIRMVENDVGGGFGARGEFYPEDFLIPFAARLTGRPVKWIEDRREHLAATNHAREAECELEIACDRDGTIRALRGHALTDQGAYIRTNGPTAARNVAQVLSGPYRIPHSRIDVSLMMTNKTPAGTYRGPGRYEADFFRERLFDIAAAELGIDPVEFRRRNLIAEAEMPYRL